VGNPTFPKSVKLIASLIYKKKKSLCVALEKMLTHWNTLDFISETIFFDHTDYYEKEMGEGLWRSIVGFETLINPDQLPSIKHLTNEIEASLSPETSGRTVNIDPGYINTYHLILSSTKPCPHRPYLQNGIYADLTLIFREKSFRAFPWTYPDYRSDKMITIMNVLRQKYLFQLRKGSFSEPRNLEKESI